MAWPSHLTDGVGTFGATQINPIIDALSAAGGNRNGNGYDLGANRYAQITALQDAGAKTIIHFVAGYAFSQTPSGTLTGGTPATVTLAPVPLGLNAADVGHYVELPDHGTAEAVLITGGTAVAGASTGTITFTPAHSHSAGFAITTASGGIAEAVNAASAGGGGTVMMPGGNITINATINMQSFIHLKGAGAYSTQLQRTGDFGDTFKCGSSSAGIVNVRFSDFSTAQIINYVAGTPGTASNLPTNGSHFNLLGCNTVFFDHIRLADMYQNVSIVGGSEIHFLFCQFAGTYDARSSAPKATLFQLVTTYDATLGIPTYIRLYGCDFVGSNNGTTNSSTNYAGIAGAYGIVLRTVEDFEMFGGSMGGAVNNNLLVQSLSGTLINMNIRVIGVKFDSAGQSDVAFLSAGGSNPAAGDVLINDCEFNGEVAGYSAITVFDASSGNPPVYGLKVSNNLCFAYIGAPIVLRDGGGLDISGNTVYYYNTLGGIASDFSSAVYVGGRATGFSVKGNTIGGGQAFEAYNGTTNKCLYGVFVNALGTTNKGTIAGNVEPTPGSIGTPGDLMFNQVLHSATYANRPLAVNGQTFYCSDGKVTSGVDNTLVASGTGALAVYINGAWKAVQ